MGTGGFTTRCAQVEGALQVFIKSGWLQDRHRVCQHHGSVGYIDILIEDMHLNVVGLEIGL